MHIFKITIAGAKEAVNIDNRALHIIGFVFIPKFDETPCADLGIK